MNHTILVYGTLRSGFGLNAVLRRSGAAYVGLDSIRGMEMYHLGGFPMICASDDPEATIHGEVYRVDDATLADLDSIEGFRSEGHPHNHYDRVKMQTSGGREVWVYTQGHPKDAPRHARVYRAPRISHGDFTRGESDQGRQMNITDERWIEVQCALDTFIAREFAREATA